MKGILIGSLALLLAGCAAPTNTACICPVAKVNNGWCSQCALGYVAGVTIESELLFEAVDAHGHDIDPGGVQCSSCRKAMETDGYCNRHRIGWVNQQAYLSTLTYRLAKGQAKDTSKITCPICRANALTQGWCDSCGVGMVGNVAFGNKEDFQQASQPYEILLAAVEAAGTCEMCAGAMLFESTCPVCKISYKDGKGVPWAP
ncbi:MAG: hypothetical protein O6933_09390 [Planctomycetota bacterium]|nr:hypothetical protein [Planctomycetota bacterium]